MGSSHPIYVVKGAWHMPMGIREGADFAAVLKSILETQKALQRETSTAVIKDEQDRSYLLATIETLDTVDEKFEFGFTSYFSYKSTTNELLAFYHSLLTMRISQQENVDAMNTTTKITTDIISSQRFMNKLRRPPMILTEGDEKKAYDIADHMRKEGLGELLRYFIIITSQKSQHNSI
jgi:hypothetical protein